MAGRFAQDRFVSSLFPLKVKQSFSCVSTSPDTPLYSSNFSKPAFSLLELLVVLSIAALLMGLLMPSFIRIRESARQASCASNLHQMGIALMLYVDENGEHLPSSYFSGNEGRNGGRKAQPGEMISAYLGKQIKWDSLGWLYQTKFILSPEVFYCPSHTGQHPFERYADDWVSPGSKAIEINYHYRNDISGMVLSRQRYSYFAVREGSSAIVSDGLRTKQDFNHVVGANILRIDSVVQWVNDTNHKIYEGLPDEYDDGKQKWQNPWTKLTKR